METERDIDPCNRFAAGAGWPIWGIIWGMGPEGWRCTTRPSDGLVPRLASEKSAHTQLGQASPERVNRSYLANEARRRQLGALRCSKAVFASTHLTRCRGAFME
jgi:hypothetical protein